VAVDYTECCEVARVTDVSRPPATIRQRFLADKPEKASILYAAEYGVAYFRKM
jgi:hypothetical protein